MHENFNYQDSEYKILELPKEDKEKLDAMKSKLDKFSKEIVKENKEIMAVGLLPPSKFPQFQKLSNEEDEKLKNRINILIIADLEEKKDWYELRDKIIKNVNKKAEEIDNNIVANFFC